MEAFSADDWQNEVRTETRARAHSLPWCQKNSCLHRVVAENDLEKLELALLHPDVDLDCRGWFGNTLLITSLRYNCSDTVIVRLIDAGCDINKAKWNFSPLHKALTRPSIKVAQRMVEKGANVNALDISNLTPLQSVIANNNLEAADLLIQAGADVNMAEDPRMLPLMMAIKWHTKTTKSTHEIFLESSSHQQYEENIAFEQTEQLVIDLINAGADVNCVCIDENYWLLDVVECGCTRLFKLIWSKLDHKLLLNSTVPFAFLYVCQSLLYPDSECLHLVLTCPVAGELIRKCVGEDSTSISFVSPLLYHLRKFKDTKDRTETIELCMELGAVVTIPDIDLAIELYGFSNELRALVCSNNFRKEDYVLEKLHPLPTFVLAIEENSSAQFVIQLFKNQIKSSFCINNVLRALKYFSMPQYIKQELIDLCVLLFPRLVHRITHSFKQVPQFPSLLELSRNKAREYIKDTHRVEKPLEFHEAVASLHLPSSVKDILLFKTPLYP